MPVILSVLAKDLAWRRIKILCEYTAALQRPFPSDQPRILSQESPHPVGDEAVTAGLKVGITQHGDGHGAEGIDDEVLHRVHHARAGALHVQRWPDAVDSEFE